MSAESKGGAAAWIWVVIGLLVGLASGWWMGQILPYTLLFTLFGWFAGLSLANMDDAEH